VSFAVFLDRDGTLIEDRHYLGDPDGVELLPNAVEGLRLMRQVGAALVVVTNQSGVARGYFDQSAVHAVNARVTELLAADGVELAGIYVCPHGPTDGCDCRKPAPGLLLRAADELGLELASSYLVGDSERDVEAAKRAGATPLLLGSDAADLLEAAELIRATAARA
jgi:D-glycero-D-manno-heptose 1,7-bisphosphate phosphatase